LSKFKHSKKKMTKGSIYICDCKAVKVHEIRSAIKTKGAQTLLDIQNITKASTGCGRCKQPVTDILNAELRKIEVNGKQLRLNL
jgi:NAD(P)H-nitrite reductase large subunit